MSQSFKIYIPSVEGNRDFYNSAMESKYTHEHTLGLGNYRGKAFVTGCSGKSCYKKTEILDRSTMKWSDGADYPFTSDFRSVGIDFRPSCLNLY